MWLSTAVAEHDSGELEAYASSSGIGVTPSLAEWARAAKEALTLAQGKTGVSASDLVLDERRQRQERTRDS